MPSTVPAPVRAGPRAEGDVPSYAAWRGVADGRTPESCLSFSPPLSVPPPEAQLRPLSASAAAKLGAQGRSWGPQAGVGGGAGARSSRAQPGSHVCIQLLVGTR